MEKVAGSVGRDLKKTRVKNHMDKKWKSENTAGGKGQ